MPHLIVIGGHDGQRRQLEERLFALEKGGWALAGKFEAQASFPDWRALFENAGIRGLFAEKQVTVSEGSDTLGPFPDDLAPLLEGPDAESVVIATFSGQARKVFPKAVLALKKVVFLEGEASVPPWKRRDWLLSLARQKGYRLTPPAAELLAESVESQEELRSELDKLGTFAGQKAIGPELVQALSFDEGAGSQLRFLDGVCRADPKEVARSLKHLSEGPLLPVLTSIVNRLRPALILVSFKKHQAEVLKAIGADREYALRMARSALSAFGADGIRTFMLKAVHLCLLEKTSLAQGWPGFELILWDLMQKAGTPRDINS